MIAKKPLRILLVEDHHIMRRGLASLLKAEIGAEILGEAGDGVSAIESLETLYPDAIIMDISLPRLNGLEATRRIKQKYPRIPVLILSMYNNPRFVYQALKAGAFGYILKDSLVEELIQALQKAIRGEIFISKMIEEVDVEAFPTEMQPVGVSPFERLSTRECEVLQLLAEGKTVAEIASELVISTNTVYTHQSNIKNKLGLHNRNAIVRYAIENNLVAGNPAPIDPPD